MAELGYRRQWDACRRIQGPTHLDTLGSMNNLAGTLRALGNLAGARDVYQQVLSLVRGSYGMRHPAGVITMGNLAETMHALGELAQARLLQEVAIAAAGLSSELTIQSPCAR